MAPRTSTSESIVKEFERIIDSEKKQGVGFSRFISLKDASKFLDNDTLNVSAKVEEMDAHQLRVRPTLPNQIPLQFDNKKVFQFHDIAIRVSESEDMKDVDSQVFHSFRLILATVSPYFEDLFTIGMKESVAKEIVLRGINPTLFRRILQFIHTNKILIQDITDCANLLKEADKFMIKRLIDEVVYYLQLRISCDTLWEIWKIADDYAYKELEKNCISFMKISFKEAFASPAWIDVKESIAMKALQLDKIKNEYDESIFFDALIRWRQNNLRKIENNDKQNEDKIIENKILSLVSQLNDLKSIQAKKQKSSVESVESHTSTPKDSSQLKELTRKERILRWKEENTILSPMDQIFANMIYCIRFSQMKGDYIANVVEKNEDVMRVNGINYLLQEAYRYIFIKDKDMVEEELKSRSIK
ncbi:hypothetical protein BDF14DRAFT_1838106 [Spinellus fusiger]|nr:hypothetical protein BDF14DRAFT_1838106 [Spinellus fusiger]